MTNDWLFSRFNSNTEHLLVIFSVLNQDPTISCSVLKIVDEFQNCVAYQRLVTHSICSHVFLLSILFLFPNNTLFFLRIFYLFFVGRCFLHFIGPEFKALLGAELLVLQGAWTLFKHLAAQNHLLCRLVDRIWWCHQKGRFSSSSGFIPLFLSYALP